MGRFLDLLKNAGGERSLYSAIGRWRVAVSQALDTALDTSQQYNQVRRSPFEQSFAGPGDVIFDDVPTSVGALIYNTTTGEWTLDANTTYELEFFGFFDNFGNAGDVVQTEWVDSTNTTLVTPFGATFGGYFTPGGLSTIGASNKPVSKVIYSTGPSPEIVKVRVTNVTSTVDLQAGSYAIVRRIR